MFGHRISFAKLLCYLHPTSIKDVFNDDQSNSRHFYKVVVCLYMYLKKHNKGKFTDHLTNKNSSVIGV